MQDAGSLCTFLGMIGWLAGNVPHLAEIRQPLVHVLAAAGECAPTKSKLALASVPLTGLWGPEHDAAFARCQEEALRGGGFAVETYIPPSTDDTLIVMSDASRLGWAGFGAACPTAELDKPVAAWQLRPVAFFGGVFTSAELAWSIPEKEVVAQVRTAQKAQHMYRRPAAALLRDRRRAGQPW